MLFWPSGSAFPYNQLDATAKAVTGQLKGVITYTVYDTATNASTNQFVLTTTIGDLKGLCLGHRQGFYDEITEFRYIILNEIQMIELVTPTVEQLATKTLASMTNTNNTHHQWATEPVPETEDRIEPITPHTGCWPLLIKPLPAIKLYKITTIKTQRQLEIARVKFQQFLETYNLCLLYTSPSPRDS